MRWVAGFPCPVLLYDIMISNAIHPLHLALSFLCLVEFDKQYEKTLCGIYLIDTEYSVVEDLWCVWATRYFLMS